jgi:hypothetical protein
MMVRSASTPSVPPRAPKRRCQGVTKPGQREGAERDHQQAADLVLFAG